MPTKKQKTRAKAQKYEEPVMGARRPSGRPQHRCDKWPCSTPTCEHYRSPLEVEISAAIKELLNRMVPRGQSVEVNDWSFGGSIRLVCGGCVPIMAYSCCLKPNHEGQCYTKVKNCHFTSDPENR